MATEGEIVIATAQYAITNYSHVAAYVIFFYDYLLTISDEINYIWRHPLALSSIAFFVNRYYLFTTNLAGLFFLLISYVNHRQSVPSNICGKYKLYRSVTLPINEIIVAVITLIRMRGIYSSNHLRIMSYFGIILTLFSIIMSVYPFINMDANPSPARASDGSLSQYINVLTISGCQTSTVTNESSEINVLSGGAYMTKVTIEAAPWEAMLLWDITIFISLLVEARSKFILNKSRNLFSAPNLPISTLIWRDGASYFIYMIIANLANISTYYASTQASENGSLSFLNVVISGIMMSRFMLNLHTTSSEATHRLESSDTLSVSDLQKHTPPNAPILGSKIEGDIWDSKFTLTQDSRVFSFDAFGSEFPESRTQPNKTFMSGLDSFQEKHPDNVKYWRRRTDAELGRIYSSHIGLV